MIFRRAYYLPPVIDGERLQRHGDHPVSLRDAFRRSGLPQNQGHG
jgi:hypothetical protein